MAISEPHGRHWIRLDLGICAAFMGVVLFWTALAALVFYLS